MKTSNVALTPREVLSELDRFVVGQDDAKRAVAGALRNRWRRLQVRPPLRNEITPKNILMIGPTGVGKTEIARRLAALAGAPFVKVEASKYTEVGYVGRDVESMIRDLTEIAVSLVKAEESDKVATRARAKAMEQVLDTVISSNEELRLQGRDEVKRKLASGQLDEMHVNIEQTESQAPFMSIFANMGMEDVGNQLKDMMGNALPKKTRQRTVTVREALSAYEAEQRDRLLDPDRVNQMALERVQNSGIVFIDEMDKVASRESGHGPDVSREGVQRDLLPIVEGTQVTTKYGVVKTDHILFIAAGAFHVSKVSDLIPEIQGRFPVRVELSALTRDDFVRILREPDNSLVKQYEALLATENVTLSFADDGIEAIADVAAELNTRFENIGARRLHTVMEKILEDISFHAPERSGQTCVIDGPHVRAALTGILKDDDLTRYIL